jgi:hypothetical protein
LIEHDAFRQHTSGQVVSGAACMAGGHAGAPDGDQGLDGRQHLPLWGVPGILAAIAETA